MDSIGILLNIVILLNLTLVVSSTTSHKSDDKGLMYFVYLLNITTIVFWTGSVCFYRIVNQNSLDLATRVLYCSATLIASSFYYFSLIFPDHKNYYRGKLAGVIIVNCLLILLIFTTDTIIRGGVILESGENAILFGKYFFIFSSYILYYFFSSFLRLFIKYLRYSTNDQKKFQVLFVCMGYTVSGIISFITNLFLHNLGNFKYIWVGPTTSSILVVLSITYAMTQHRLFNIKMIVTEIFVFIIWTATLVNILVFEPSITIDQILVRIFFLLISIATGIFLIKSVKKQIEQHEENIELVNELTKANHQLKEVDEIKSKFVSLARHQMASPLTAINAYASLLNDKDVNLDKIGLKSLQGIIDRFVVIVRDFLAISQIENEEMKYSKDDVDLNQAVNDILCDRSFIIDHHSIDVQLDVGPDDYKIKGDKSKIDTAVANVLENSIQYSKNSKIVIKLSKKDSKVILTIKDQGVRSLPEISPVLLKKFSPDPFEATIMGNGLGVYIAKRFVEAHGGSFEIKNNKGCQFMLVFPQ